MRMNEEDIDLVHPPYLSVRGRIICSQEDFKKYAIELEQQLQAYKDKENKLREILKKRIDKVESIIWTEETGERHFGASYSDVGYARAMKDILEILNEGDK